MYPFSFSLFRFQEWPSLQSTTSYEDWGAEDVSVNPLPPTQWGPKRTSEQTDGNKPVNGSNTIALATPVSTTESVTIKVPRTDSERTSSSPPPRETEPPSSGDPGTQNQSSRETKDTSPRTMFGSGAKTSMVFSLSREKELVKSQDKRGKARGRGRVGSNNPPPQVGETRNRSTGNRPMKYPAPKSGSKGIMVIKPLDKGDVDDTPQEREKIEDVSSEINQSQEEEDQPGLPLRAGRDKDVVGDSSSVETVSAVGDEEGKKETVSPMSHPHHVGGGQVTSKPKRYSSQRQQKGAGGSGHSEEQGTKYNNSIFHTK